MSKLILIRGLPGSGKSTVARNMLANGAVDWHFEADMWLVDKMGVYRWTRERSKLAHASCIKAASVEMAKGKRVVVSNTFTQLWEMQPYIDAAKESGAEVEVLVARGNFGSIHNVPPETLNAMRDRWETVKAERYL